ncbi:MAG: hypothetical protein ACE5R6_00270 [Candidatus Heimdallarchaeota archaeon]
MIVFIAPFIISLLLFGLLLTIYIVVKITIKLVHWVVRKLANLVCWEIQTTRQGISKGSAAVRRVAIYVIQAIRRLVMACSRWIDSLNQHFHHRGYPTYHTPIPYNTEQEKGLETMYCSSSDLINRTLPIVTSTSLTEDINLRTSIERKSARQVGPIHFCQICGAFLDLSLPSPEMSIICCECGSDLSLGIDPICRKHVIRGEDAVRCPHCLTVFHRHHISVWLSTQGRCPFCNSSFTPETTKIT